MSTPIVEFPTRNRRRPLPGSSPRRREVSFTVYSSLDRLSKAYRLLDDGSVATKSGTEFWRGEYHVVTVDANDPRRAQAEIGRTIDELTSEGAIGTGVPRDGSTTGRVTTKAKFAEGAAGVPRDLAHFAWSEDLGLLLLDGDENDGLHATLSELYPPFADVAFLSRPSASASVVDPSTGEPLKRGEHGYVLIDEPTKSKQCLEAFMRLAWCTGRDKAAGVLKLSKRGDVLVRGPVDASVGSPERLSYEGAAVVGPGLETIERKSTVVGGNGILSAADLIEFADRCAPRARYDELRQKAANEPEFLARRDAVRAAYRGEHIKSAVKRGTPREKAEREYDEATALGVTRVGEWSYVPLTSDHQLYTPDGKAFTVADIQAEPDRFHKTECADPIEGLEYQSKNPAIIYTDAIEWPRIMIYSRAHSDAFCYVAPLPAETPWEEVFEGLGDDDEPQPAAAASVDDLDGVWNPFAQSTIAPDFPFDALPDYLQAWSEHRSLTTGADRCGFAMADLTALGGAIDHRIKVVLKDDEDDPFLASSRLWTLLCGDPSVMKTPIINAAIKPLRELDARAMARYKEARAVWQFAVGTAKREKAPPPPEPRQPHLHLCDDTTPERLAALCAEHPQGLLVVSSELARLIGQMDRYSAGNKAAGGERAFWNQVYDGGPYRMARQGSGEQAGKSDRFIANLSGGILAAVQPDKLKALGQLDDDGFLQRFTPVILRRPGPERDGHAVRADAAKIRREVIEAVARYTPNDFVGGRIRLSPEAREVRNRIRDLRAVLQGATEPSKAFGAFCGKIENVFGALSLILHLVERPRAEAVLDPVAQFFSGDVAAHADPVVEFISGDVAARAARIVEEFIVPHALVFYEELSDSQADVTPVAAFILDHKGERLTLRDLRHGPRATRLAHAEKLADVQRILFPFEIGGWLEPKINRPSNREWRITRGLAERFAAEREAYRARVAAIKARIGRGKGGGND